MPHRVNRSEPIDGGAYSASASHSTSTTSTGDEHSRMVANSIANNPIVSGNQGGMSVGIDMWPKTPDDTQLSAGNSSSSNDRSNRNSNPFSKKDGSKNDKQSNAATNRADPTSSSSAADTTGQSTLFDADTDTDESTSSTSGDSTEFLHRSTREKQPANVINVESLGDINKTKPVVEKENSDDDDSDSDEDGNGITSSDADYIELTNNARRAGLPAKWILRIL